jgi:CBS domain-containing protein
MPDNNFQTTALIVILHNTNLLPALLKAWRRIGVPGVTILPSAGSFQAENWARRSGLGSILNLLEQGNSPQRTLLSLITDPEILELAISEADRVVKGFDSPRSGILFTIPVGQTLGLKKWGASPKPPAESEINSPPGRDEASNLMKWFQEDVKEKYGEAAILDWSVQRNTPVSEIIQVLTLKPTIVQVDTPLSELMTKLLANPGMPVAFVVNNAERLMGTIDISTLAEAVMAPVMPEAFINTPSGYEKAIKFANIHKQQIAADFMDESPHVFTDETLEQTYRRMKAQQISGLPVVDRNYRVKGYITLLELIAVCFAAGAQE